MSIPLIPLTYQERNLLFLEEVLDELRWRGMTADFLFRASEREELDRILTYGTDRGGFSGIKLWCDGPDLGRAVRHEDVIFATTEEEIRLGESDLERSTSLKKFTLIEHPLLLVYDARQWRQLCDRQYESCAPTAKLQSLLAIFTVTKLPPIHGWFSEAAGLSYRSLVKSINAGTVVEVGCWKGLSTSYIGRICMAQRTRLFAVDTWTGSSDHYHQNYQRLLTAEDVPAAFRRHLAERSIDATILQMPSLAAVSIFQDDSLDLVFLDASHDYAAITADLTIWFDKLRPGGIFAGHDFNDRHPGVKQAVAEFTMKHMRSLQTSPGDIWWFEK